MAPTTSPTLVGTGSHHISLDQWNGGQTEEVYFYFEAVWRNAPALVHMAARRYTSSDGQWTDWQVWAEGPAYAKVEDANGGRGPHLTDTAKSRLGADARPLVVEWLAGRDYAPSRADAFADALLRIAGDLDGYSDPPSARLRRALATHRAELVPAMAARLDRAAAAWDAYRGILSGKVGAPTPDAPCGFCGYRPSECDEPDGVNPPDADCEVCGNRTAAHDLNPDGECVECVDHAESSSGF